MESLGIRDLLKNDWMASIDLKDACIPFSSNLGGSPEIPPLPITGQGVRVSVSSLWPVQCTLCLHQAAETSVDASTLSRNTTDNVPGRCVSDGTVQNRARETTRADHFSPGDTRICSQLRGVPVTANPEI